MTEGKIFISYRRDDSAYAAGRLFDRLSERFGEENIFMDVEGIEPGVDFHDALSKAVSCCDVLIALIGKQWLDIKDEKGNRRLDYSGDFVRIEIASALDRDIRVIPVLVQGTNMPSLQDLPQVLQKLARLNYLEIRHERFNADVDRLVRGIETYIKEGKERREQEAAEKATRAKAEQERRSHELAQQEKQIANYLEVAKYALDEEDWQTAQSNYREILKLRPHQSDAQIGLQTASRNLELAQLYGRAILQKDEGQLERALKTLNRILGIDENYRDVPAMISAIETLIAERAGQVSPSWRKHLHERLSDLPRELWYLGGVTGLILIVVLAVWGGGEILDSHRDTDTPTPTLTTVVAMLLTETNSQQPVTGTIQPVDIKESISSDTPKPEPTSTDTSTPEPTITFSQTPDELPSLITDDYGVPMALVPAGTFQMGGDADDDLAECLKELDDCSNIVFIDEEPIHTVTLNEYYIDQYEVTNLQYASCVESGHCNPPSDISSRTRENYYGNSTYDNYPVIYVDWPQAQAYCQWRGARLPTEAEWEKAARGGLEGAIYPWGDEFPVCDFGVKNGAQYSNCDDDTVAVGSFAANNYGLYDMSGNVKEWTQSLYLDYPYDPTDGRENTETSGTRVRRGGSFAHYGFAIQIAIRDTHDWLTYQGFRCARDISSSSAIPTQIIDDSHCVYEVTERDASEGLNGILSKFDLVYDENRRYFYHEFCEDDPPKCSPKIEIPNPNEIQFGHWIIIENVSKEKCETIEYGYWIP